MRICFFYRLGGGKTSYQYIKSFIKYLKTIHSKVIYFSQFFPKVGLPLRWEASYGERIRTCDLLLPVEKIYSEIYFFQNTCKGYFENILLIKNLLIIFKICIKPITRFIPFLISNSILISYIRKKKWKSQKQLNLLVLLTNNS